MNAKELPIVFFLVGVIVILPIVSFFLIKSVKSRLARLQEDFSSFRREQNRRFALLIQKIGALHDADRGSGFPGPPPVVEETAAQTATPPPEEPGVVPCPPVPSPSGGNRQRPPASGVAFPPPRPDDPGQPSPVKLLFQRLGDWFAVRGDFSTNGTTREFMFVTRWLTRIGTILLAGCILYFMKLSVDRGWVGPAGRTASAIAGGAAFAALGAWMIRKTRYAQVGHAVAGLGFLGMYLGFGLGHRFFDPPVIVSASFAFCALAAVTALAGVFSVYLPSAGVSVLALLGGYLAPVVAGTDSGNPLRLYLYLSILNCAAAFVAHRRGWSALNFLAAAGAFLLSGCWQMQHANAPKGIFLLSFGFGTFAHLLYLATTVAGAKVRGKAGNALAWAGLVLNAAWYLRWICYTLKPVLAEEASALVVLACVAVYILTAHASLKRGWADRGTLQLILLFAFAYLAFALHLMVEPPNLVPAWCLVAAVAGESAKRTRQPVLGYVGLALLALACILSLGRFASPAYHWGESFDLLPAAGYWKSLGIRLFRFACVPATLAAFAWRRWCPAKNEALVTFLWCVAVAVAFLHITAESRLFGAAFLPSLKGGTVTLAWTFVSAGTLIAGILARIKTVRVLALTLLGIAVLKLLLSDTAFLETPWRVLTFGLTGAVLFAGALAYLKFKERFEQHDA